MPLPSFLAQGSRKLRGTSKLHLPWLDPEERIQTCESTLSIEPSDNGSVCALWIDWAYQGTLQQGMMLIAGDEARDRVEIAWTDSWHMASGVMHLVDETFGSDQIKGAGKYFTGHDSPDWGWRIEILQQNESVRLIMFNIDPSGADEWAVEALYEPADD